MEMNGSIINRVNSIKYLGVIIDHKLNWIEPIAYVQNKFSKGVGILFRARHFLCRRSLINPYYSFVYPYLVYCIEAWGSACQTHLHPLLLRVPHDTINLVNVSARLWNGLVLKVCGVHTALSKLRYNIKVFLLHN